MIRATRLLILAAAAAFAVAACGGSVSTNAPSEAAAVSEAPASAAPPAAEAPPSAAPAASAAAEGPDVNAAAAALEDIDKYALDIKVAGLMETASEASEITMSGTVDREAERLPVRHERRRRPRGSWWRVGGQLRGHRPRRLDQHGRRQFHQGAGRCRDVRIARAGPGPRDAARLDADGLTSEPAGRRPGGQERRRHDPLPRDGCGFAPGGRGSRARLGGRPVDRRRRRVHRVDGDGRRRPRQRNRHAGHDVDRHQPDQRRVDRDRSHRTRQGSVHRSRHRAARGRGGPLRAFAA